MPPPRRPAAPVMTTSGLNAAIWPHTRSIHSSSILSRAALWGGGCRVAGRVVEGWGWRTAAAVPAAAPSRRRGSPPPHLQRGSLPHHSITPTPPHPITHQSSSLINSTLVWFSPFLYSSGQSSSSTRGLWIFLLAGQGRAGNGGGLPWRRRAPWPAPACTRRGERARGLPGPAAPGGYPQPRQPPHLRMRAGTTTSFSNMTPRSTRLPSIAPPAIFSTLAYFLGEGRKRGGKGAGREGGKAAGDEARARQRFTSASGSHRLPWLAAPP